MKGKIFTPIFTIFLIIFLIFIFTGTASAADPVKEGLCVIISGSAGVGAGDFRQKDTPPMTETETTEIAPGPSAWNALCFSPRASFRVVNLKHFEKPKPIARGLGAQIEIRQTSMRGTAPDGQIYTFGTLSASFFPGYQVIHKETVGLFAGPLGIGTDMSSTERPVVERETGGVELYRIFIKVLPIEVDFWATDWLGFNFNFSGLEVWAGEERASKDLYWLMNAQIGVGISLGFF